MLLTCFMCEMIRRHELKKTIICNIPMKKDVFPSVYESVDSSLPVSEEPFMYPINAFLAKTINNGDSLDVILLVKNDDYDCSSDNIERYKAELASVCGNVDVSPVYYVIRSDFDEKKDTHALLMNRIIDNINDDSHIFADITYGPKDLPIVVFAALLFAENYLRCSVDNIIYGQASFKDNRVVNTKICDMIPLYCMSALSNTINCNDPDKARIMIKNLLAN